MLTFSTFVKIANTSNSSAVKDDNLIVIDSYESSYQRKKSDRKWQNYLNKCGKAAILFEFLRKILTNQEKLITAKLCKKFKSLNNQRVDYANKLQTYELQPF